jgi:hypothetical protein
MASAIQDTSVNSENGFRVCVTSIGTAVPSASAAVAQGLGISTQKVIHCLYRAPSILVDKIDEKVAGQMVNLLTNIGFVAHAEPQEKPLPNPERLYDVSVYIEDATQVYDVADTLCNFVGMSKDDALKALMSPSGVVLGRVSQATVDALNTRLGEGVSVLQSRPEDAKFSIVLNDGAEVVKRRILEDLEKQEQPILAREGLVLADMPHTAVRDLWQRHQATGLLHVVNQDFMRFDIILDAYTGDDMSKAAEVLETHAGIPADMIEEVLAETPITLNEAVPMHEMQAIADTFGPVGLETRAEMITFQHVGLMVTEVGEAAEVSALFASLGVQEFSQILPRAPFDLGFGLPELQARMWKAALEDRGCEVEFFGGAS